MLPSIGCRKPLKAAATLYVAEAVLVLPALSVAEQLTLWPVPMLLVLTGLAQLDEAIPEPGVSLAPALAMASAPTTTGFGETVGFSVGLVRSTLILFTAAVAWLPALS